MFPVEAYQLKNETVYYDWLHLQMQIIQDRFQQSYILCSQSPTLSSKWNTFHA